MILSYGCFHVRNGLPDLCRKAKVKENIQDNSRRLAGVMKRSVYAEIKKI
jgi:hypothetical protein